MYDTKNNVNKQQQRKTENCLDATKTKYQLSDDKIHNKCCPNHSFQNKQQQTNKNKGKQQIFQMPQKKQSNYLIIKYIINIAKNSHFRVNNKKQRKTRKNTEKQKKTTKSKKSDLKKAHQKKDLSAPS